MDGSLVIISAPFATLEIVAASVTDKYYDENGDIDFNDDYLASSSVWSLYMDDFNVITDDLEPTNDDAATDILFEQTNGSADIQPIDR